MDTDDNWAKGADAENLSEDKLQYVSGSSSLKFDLSGATTEGYLENTSLSTQDLSETENEGAFFLWVYLPSPSLITNVILRWGESATLFWSDTVTTQQNGSSFQTGWNLLRFDWDGASKTGLPDSANTKYTRISVVEDKRTEGLKSDLQAISDCEGTCLSNLVKKALSAFVKRYRNGKGFE